MIINGNLITPEEGMILRKGDTFSDSVRLGKYDSPENWREVPIAEYEAWETENLSALNIEEEGEPL